MAIPWFDREFTFPFSEGVYPCILERLRGLLPRVRAKIDVHGAEQRRWLEREGDLWSAQENLGHLGDLEPLWMGRLDDFEAHADVLRAADLENRQTHEAGHNEVALETVFATLARQREHFLSRLMERPASAFAQVCRHPRLDQPMRLVDLIYFVAEHDDHHLARIHTILFETSRVERA